jgi:hypothetical protein
MAWVTQEFILQHHLKMKLAENQIEFDECTIRLRPTTQDEAQKLAMMLRKAARRLEEIGKDLPVAV